ncbi:MAG: response regulator, partial [Rhodospirillaceae bacterium]|nr:response regulator [Rhodospirillaceae bacterium]
RRNKVRNPLVWVHGGQEALDYLFRRGQYAERDPAATPCMVLLDLNMPGIAGQKVLEAIKADESLRRIPVLILTTSTDPRDINRCYELGASTYIQKPVLFEKLVEAVARIRDYWFEVAILPREAGGSEP